MESQMKKGGKKRSTKIINGYTNSLEKEITTNTFTWLEHLTVVDLSNKNLSTIDDNAKFPLSLVDLNLSHNQLVEVPTVVVNLSKLKRLDISHNKLKCFDEMPNFSNTIEVLNLSYNFLNGPPCWIWMEAASRLCELDLSFNINLTLTFKNCPGFLAELIQYETTVTHLKINNCRVVTKNHWKILETFPKVKVIVLGSDKLSLSSLNNVSEVPCKGLETCCDIESLNLSNTHLYTVKNSIDIFTSLVEIDLSQNFIWSLPEEFCNLHNLEDCNLSQNSLMYLPDELGKLKKLLTLNVAGNKLCMLPSSIIELTNLKHLDVYDNCLCEIPENLGFVEEVDYAQNYFNEPDDVEYVQRKQRLRLNLPERCDGRKMEPVTNDEDHSQHSPDTSDDESYRLSIANNSNAGQQNNDPPSSLEDWDSDEYWVPMWRGLTTQTTQAKWLSFVKRKMDEGNFCPMDAHTVSIAEKVKYEKMCYPRVEHESDGQFDDFSEDDS